MRGIQTFAIQLILLYLDVLYETTGETWKSYSEPTRGESATKLFCISLNCVLFCWKLNPLRKKQQEKPPTVLHCTGPSHGCALSCAVSSCSTLWHFSWWFLKVRRFQLCEHVCVCVCVSVGQTNGAHCHSIQWPNAKGSGVQHHSLLSLVCPFLPWLRSLLSLSHLSRLAENHDGAGGCWGAGMSLA